MRRTIDTEAGHESDTSASGLRSPFSNPQSPLRPAPSRAWAPYEPEASSPWDLRKAGHLFRRAGFGATWSQLQQALADGPQKTIDRLLHPAEADAWNRQTDEFENRAIDPDATGIEPMRQWWLRRMIATPHPLLEKMTLFWHGHFAIDGTKATGGRLMHSHVQLLRRHALGRFSDLLAGVVRDPAVLSAFKTGGRGRIEAGPSFARHLLGVFTVSEGSVSDQDVRETVRAMSGWMVLHHQIHYAQPEHNAGEKTILGQRGNWTIDDVVRIVLAQPDTARRLVGKLYRWLISETEPPCDSLLTPLVESFAVDYNIGHLVETMLRSNLFFSPTAYRQRIKSPVEYVLSIVRPLGEMIPTMQLGQDLAALGQNVGRPPTTAGWPGGRAWINRFSAIARSNLAASLLAESGPYGDKLAQLRVVKSQSLSTPAKAARFLLDLFLQNDVSPEVLTALPSRDLLYAIVTLPEFHLA